MAHHLGTMLTLSILHRYCGTTYTHTYTHTHTYIGVAKSLGLKRTLLSG